MKNNIKKMATISLLVAVAIVLKLVSIQLPGTRLTFYNVPIMLTGFLFGPVSGLIAGMLTDVASVMYQPGWLPQFMLSAMLWGLIPGLFRKAVKNNNLSAILGVEVLTHVVVSFVNTILLGLSFGFDFALGSVNTNLEIGFNLFGWQLNILSAGTVVNLRIIFVVILMIIKIPIDVVILRKITKRVFREEWKNG